MIDFISHTEFNLPKPDAYRRWLFEVIKEEQFSQGELNFLFYSDEELHKLNLEFLGHNTFTDVITFDYNHNNLISGDICISVDRVKENATTYNVSFYEELARVMVHGVLHLCGYKDKTEDDILTIRQKENYYISKFETDI